MNLSELGRPCCDIWDEERGIFDVCVNCKHCYTESIRGDLMCDSKECVHMDLVRDEARRRMSKNDAIEDMIEHLKTLFETMSHTMHPTETKYKYLSNKQIDVLYLHVAAYLRKYKTEVKDD